MPMAAMFLVYFLLAKVELKPPFFPTCYGESVGKIDICMSLPTFLPLVVRKLLIKLILSLVTSHHQSLVRFYTESGI